MDYITKKECEGLAKDIKAKEIAIEADKYTFEMKLRNGMGKHMMEKLNNPDKPSFWLSIKLKFARWFKRIKENFDTTIDCGTF